MDDLILASLQGQLSAIDAARLDAWRRASPENEAQYQDLARVWRLADHRDPFVADVSQPPSMQALLARSARREAEVPKARGGSRHRWAVLIGTMAAAASIAIAVVRVRGDGDRTNAPYLSTSEFVTDTAETATARLDDGSVVRLAPSSRLRVTPVADQREVWLDGEAFFAVARDETRPFRVRTRAGKVEVLGTRFDVRVEGSGMRLVVTEGRVALSTADRHVEVGAGEVATVASDGTLTIARTPDPTQLLEWMRGFLVFQDTPLRQVAHELEGRFGVRVLLPDSALASRTVTAWFTHQDLDQILAAVCSAVDAHCTLRDGVASIEP